MSQLVAANQLVSQSVSQWEKCTVPRRVSKNEKFEIKICVISRTKVATPQFWNSAV